MSKRNRSQGVGRRATTLALIILVQALCAGFFLFDILSDFISGSNLDTMHLVVEAVATVGLTAGVVYLMIELRALLERMDAMEDGLKAARGEMVDLIDASFARWGLSAAEKDVAMFILKGLDNESIATLRNTAAGTVRAQATAVYSKAGVDGRAHFFSLFMEELLVKDGPEAQIAQVA